MESYRLQAFGQFSGVYQFHFFSSVRMPAVPTPGFCEPVFRPLSKALRSFRILCLSRHSLTTLSASDSPWYILTTSRRVFALLRTVHLGNSLLFRDEAMFSELMPRAIDCAIAEDWAGPFHLHAVPDLYHAGAVFSLLQRLQLWLA